MDQLELGFSIQVLDDQLGLLPHLLEYLLRLLEYIPY